MPYGCHIANTQKAWLLKEGWQAFLETILIFKSNPSMYTCGKIDLTTHTISQTHVEIGVSQA